MIESFKTNTLGPLFLTKHLAGLLKEAKHSMVVNITSGLASISDNRSGGYFSYRASKSALDMMTVNLAHELREQGTTVICVEPGWVKTDMGGSNASTTVDASVDGMITNVIAKVGIEQTGKFYTRHGKEFAW
jgi:NAD(P)-dependent dehydrogenase (short-subunit alcohol dehydrogenase family)